MGNRQQEKKDFKDYNPLPIAAHLEPTVQY
jgi:hypothetical protein